MLMTDPINTHDFLKTGVIRNQIAQPLADMITRRLAQLDYQDMPSDHCDAGPRFRGSIETHDGVRNMLESLWSKLACEDLAELTKLFHADVADHVINVIRLGDGYALDWHNHLAAKPTATLLL